MSGLPEKREPTLEAGSLILQRRPDERLRTLTEAEYQILIHGDVNEEREIRNLYGGISVGALIGFVSQLTAVDWAKAGKFPIIMTCLLLAIFLGFGLGALHCQIRLGHATKKSPYAWLRTRLDSQADSETPPENSDAQS